MTANNNNRMIMEKLRLKTYRIICLIRTVTIWSELFLPNLIQFTEQIRLRIRNWLGESNFVFDISSSIEQKVLWYSPAKSTDYSSLLGDLVTKNNQQSLKKILLINKNKLHLHLLFSNCKRDQNCSSFSFSTSFIRFEHYVEWTFPLVKSFFKNKMYKPNIGYLFFLKWLTKNIVQLMAYR